MHNSKLLKRLKWLGNHFDFLQLAKCVNVNSNDGDNYHWKPSPLKHPSLRKRESILGLVPSSFSGRYKKNTQNVKKKKKKVSQTRTPQKLHFTKARKGHRLEVVDSRKRVTSWQWTERVTTLPINTRRSSTKWRSGKDHLTGRTGGSVRGAGGGQKVSWLQGVFKITFMAQRVCFSNDLAVTAYESTHWGF